ncbi:hemerythrin domain-containing protein [Stappia sp.]|jgi:hemerythrin-like domain-containing protein|uniref:hemerythrin domain-containing protein n=1 Tax=Stappia sp. TaxID=1870903 RepID=UPI003D0D7C18
MTDSADLDSRAGLPGELRFLLEQHPRGTWETHDNLGGLMQFWLSRHDGFRTLGETLSQALGSFREGEIAAERFGGFLAPRLQHFLGELHHHHMIEDHHYFPVFMAAETRLVRGFEILEGDHELIHQRIGTVVTRANELLGLLGDGDRDRIRRAADRYAADSDRLISGLMRHLEDEEDLIVPLVLERGETELGVG